MKALKAIWNWIFYIVTGKGKVRETTVDEGLCDFSGQGRNKYGY